MFNYISKQIGTSSKYFLVKEYSIINIHIQKSITPEVYDVMGQFEMGYDIRGHDDSAPFLEQDAAYSLIHDGVAQLVVQCTEYR